VHAWMARTAAGAGSDGSECRLGQW
jgi:hypothetical protein